MTQQQPTQPDPHTWQPEYPPAPPAPQPKKQSWFARHKFLTGLLAIVLLGIVIAATGGADEAPGTTATQPAAVADGDAPAAPEPSPEPAPEPASAKVGTPVRDGNFEFTVTKVEPGVSKVGSDLFGEKAQGQFVLVHVTVTNIGTEAQLLTDSAQTVFDAEGRKFSADTAAAIYLDDNDVFLNEVNPGNTVQGVLVFDMPKDAKPASIELHDSVFSGGVSVVLG